MKGIYKSNLWIISYPSVLFLSFCTYIFEHKRHSLYGQGISKAIDFKRLFPLLCISNIIIISKKNMAFEPAQWKSPYQLECLRTKQKHCIFEWRNKKRATLRCLINEHVRLSFWGQKISTVLQNSTLFQAYIQNFK